MSVPLSRLTPKGRRRLKIVATVVGLLVGLLTAAEKVITWAKDEETSLAECGGELLGDEVLLVVCTTLGNLELQGVVFSTRRSDVDLRRISTLTGGSEGKGDYEVFPGTKFFAFDTRTDQALMQFRREVKVPGDVYRIESIFAVDTEGVRYPLAPSAAYRLNEVHELIFTPDSGSWLEFDGLK